MPPILKFIIVLGVIAALAAGYVLFSRMLDGSSGARKPSATSEKGRTKTDGAGGEKGEEGGGASTQDLIPLADITGPVMLLRDGTAECVVKVKCKNYTLLSASEKVRAVSATATAISSQPTQPMKIIHIQRPVDPTENLDWMKRILDERARMSFRLSGTDRRAASSLDRRNEMLANIIDDEQRHGKEQLRTRADSYIVLPVLPGPANEEAALQRARDMAEVLKESGFTPTILYQSELLSLCNDYLGTYRTFSENYDPYAWMPVFDGCEEEEENEVA